MSSKSQKIRPDAAYAFIAACDVNVRSLAL